MSIRKRADRQVISKLATFIWPKDRPEIRVRVAAASSCLLMAKVATVQAPVLLGSLVNTLALAPPAIPLALLGGYGLARVSGSAFNELRTVLFARVSQNACRAVALQACEKVHALDLAQLQELKPGEVQATIARGIRSVSGILNILLFNLAPTAVEFSLVLLILTMTGGLPIAAVAATTMTAYTLFTTRYSEVRTRFRRDANHAENASAALLLDSLTNAEAVKIFGNERFEAQRYDKVLRDLEISNVKVMESLGALNFGQQLIFNGGLLTTLTIATSAVVAGAMPVGDLVTISTLLFQLAIPANFLGTVYRETKANLQDFEKMQELLTLKPRISDKPGAPPLIVTRGALELRGVTVTTSERVILDKLNMTIPSGSIVGVVGASGSGKSTLLRLIARISDPSEGQILIDDQDIKDKSVDSVRSAIAVVPQDCVLFHSNIEENIRYGRPYATDEEVRQAAKAAALHEFVERLPNGYKTLVGERGTKLSGGERQRVGLARCLLKDAKIVLFDEATSALDSQTETQVMEGVRALAKGRTAVMVAHRLSTLREADTIFVLDSGKIAEQGSHDELMERPEGIYRKLWLGQFSHS